MWIHREISGILLEQAQFKPALLLTGARQTGKSSLLEKTFPNATVVSLDNLVLAEEANHNPTSFMASLRFPVIIDEIQYAPSLFREFKKHIDTQRNLSGRIFLTGSQKFELMRGVSESLAGRISVIDLSTLSASELRMANFNTEDLVQRGGFPELWKERKQSTLRFYNDYITTYLERDLRSLIQVESLRTFDRFLRALALRVCNLLNLADLGRDLGISAATANRWLDALVASGIVHLLEPWFSQESRRLVKSPKIYFRDNGLLCHLLRIHDPAAWKVHALAGQIWENFVFNELYRFMNCYSSTREVFFWRQKDGHEIDFVIEKNGKVVLIEAKMSENPDKRGLWFDKFESHTHVRAVACCQQEERLIKREAFFTFNPLLSSFEDLMNVTAQG
jgi:predicted AAA+ superfamily ATPase